MQNLLLYSAGGLGAVISIIHGYLGEMKVVRPLQAHTEQAKRILQALVFLSAVYWFAASVLLLLTPTYVPDAQRPIIAYGVALIYISGSLGNLWGTKGRHFGWALLALAAGLAIAGA
ncbi:MAG: hypothetical protein AAF608_13605 [Pseudomonadota bacterium]